MSDPTIVFPHSLPAAMVRRVIENLCIYCASDTQLTLKQGITVGADDGAEILTVGSDITLDITASGINGLDTGVESPNTWYYIYLILNPTLGLVRGLLSASATSPVLPSGYTAKRLIGAVRNDGSSNFFRFNQVNDLVYYRDNHVLINNLGNTVFIAVDCSEFVPVQVSSVLRAWFWGHSDGPTNQSQYTLPGIIGGSVGGLIRNQQGGLSPTWTHSSTEGDQFLLDVGYFSIRTDFQGGLYGSEVVAMGFRIQL
jgi:hypothetical protein